jgi:8-oxo-dGTP diphosphatase
MRGVCSGCGRVAYENAKPCAGALVVRNGKVLLVRRGIAPYRGWWDIPGGYLESDEHPEAGARRELLEETGLRVRLRGLLGVYVDRRIRPHSLNFYYLAEASGGRERASDDAVELGWFGPRELPARIAYPGHAGAVLADWRRRRV